MRSVLTAALRFRLMLVGLAAALIVLGVVAVHKMPADSVPELANGPVLEVQTEALGLSGPEVEQYVTVPIENNLLDGVMGVWDVRSRSIANLSTIDLYFEPGTTVLHARQLVEERLTNAFALPNVSQPPQLIQPLSSSDRVMMIGLTTQRLSGIQLSYLARWIVKPRLSGVAGVANVSIYGQQDRQLQVLVDPARLAASGVTLQDVINTAGNAQLVSPLSYLEGSAPGTGGFLDGPNQRLDIRPVLPLGTPNALASVPIADARGHQTLGSVAKIALGYQPQIGNGFVHGGRGLVLLVQKLPSASVLSVTKGLNAALDELRPALGGVHVDRSVFRPATYISAGLHNLALALIVGAVLALVALGALLLDARAVAIVMLGVAASLLTATAALDALGYTINALVVLGLLVGLSVLVDDALEPSLALVRRLRSRRAAGEPVSVGSLVLDTWADVRGTLGYGLALVLLVVAPVFFSHGLAATFVHPMVLSFALAVIASTIVAFTLTPALAMLLFDRGPVRRGLSVPPRVRGLYTRAVHHALELPRPALAGVLVVGLAGLVALPFLGEPSQPTFRDRSLVVHWNGPTGASLAEMDRVTRRVLARVQALPGVAEAGATLGRAVSSDRIVDPDSGQLLVTLKPGADYDRTVAAVRDVVGATPGFQASVGTFESDVLGGVLAPAGHTVDVRVYGQDYGILSRTAQRVSAAISQLPGIHAAPAPRSPQAPGIQVAVDDTKALHNGVLPGDARRQASALVSGLTVGNFFEDQAVFDVVVRALPGVRATVSDVRHLLIDTNTGHVPLSRIARVTVSPSPIDIQHEALSRYVDVIANVDGRSIGSAKSAISARLAQLRYPLEYHAEVLPSTPDSPTSHAVFVSYLIAALIGVLLLLQSAVGSWRLAALALVALPTGLAGGLLVALATGSIGSLAADAGLLAVLAFAARQGLLMLSHLRRLERMDGHRIDRASAARAALDRCAPCLGAAAVIAAALVPFVAIGDAPGAELTHSAAAVVLGGLVTSVAFVLLLLPAIWLRFGPTEPDYELEPEELTDQPELAPSPSA